MVVLLAALHSLPKEVIEAAELDNCGWGQKLVFVILPLVKPTLLNLIVLSFIGKMKIFRSRLDHHQGRAAVVDRDGLDLCLQARLRVVDLRPRLPLGDRHRLVRDRARRRADAHLRVPPARKAGVLRVQCSSARRSSWRSASTPPLRPALRVGRDDVAAHHDRESRATISGCPSRRIGRNSRRPGSTRTTASISRTPPRSCSRPC
jgi:hypothetical protein